MKNLEKLFSFKEKKKKGVIVEYRCCFFLAAAVVAWTPWTWQFLPWLFGVRPLPEFELMLCQGSELLLVETLNSPLRVQFNNIIKR